MGELGNYHLSCCGHMPQEVSCSASKLFLWLKSYLNIFFRLMDIFVSSTMQCVTKFSFLVMTKWFIKAREKPGRDSHVLSESFKKKKFRSLAYLLLNETNQIWRRDRAIEIFSTSHFWLNYSSFTTDASCWWSHSSFSPSLKPVFELSYIAEIMR